MTLFVRILGLVFALFTISGAAAAESVVHHQLQVTLTPQDGRIKVRDIITLPPHGGTLHFSLHRGWSPSSPATDVRIEPDRQTSPSPEIEEYRLSLPADSTTLTMDYQGRIITPAQDDSAGIMGDQHGTGGIIGPDGVYLDGNSSWYPRFNNELLTFSMTVDVPQSWRVISQGPYPSSKQNKTLWEENFPQEEIYLLAAPYHVYRLPADAVNFAVYLRNDDSRLANRYLSVMDDYMKLYGRLLGPYPYGKFAVVENSWESGYGMPSFTLLGPRVMRLPFILYTSLPHEILHNWWGNGVYVDYRQGNWSEGLTAYLADHLMREQAGEGVAYRRNALLRYTNYVSQGNDFPLKDFQGRHSEATQAVGYDKSLMVFHMLRLQMGDRNFIDALRRFYQSQLFHRASWDDLRQAFESVSHLSLKNEFQQWLNRTGAPSLHIQQARTEPKGKDYQLSAVITQSQSGPPYQLHIPIAVQLDGHERAWQSFVDISQRRQTIQLSLPARPWRVALDPEFDVFRRLDPGELPATLSEAMGANSLLMVLPSAASAAVREGYQRLARSWADSDANIDIRWDKDLKKLPDGRAVWLLGWENRFLADASADMGGQLSLSKDEAQLGGQNLRREDRSVVLALRRGGSGSVLVWLGCDNPAAISGLARKLPHYGSYSYLAFKGDEPTNIFKGQWQVRNSPLNIVVQQADHAVPPDEPLHLAPRTALINK